MPQLIATSDKWQAKEILFLREILNTHLGSQATPPCASKGQLESCLLQSNTAMRIRNLEEGGVSGRRGVGRGARAAAPPCGTHTGSMNDWWGLGFRVPRALDGRMWKLLQGR